MKKIKKKIEKTILHNIKDDDIDMPMQTTFDTWCWFLEGFSSQCSENVYKMLEELEIKEDWKFQSKLLNFVARKKGVNICDETECYIEQ